MLYYFHSILIISNIIKENNIFSNTHCIYMYGNYIHFVINH